MIDKLSARKESSARFSQSCPFLFYFSCERYTTDTWFANNRLYTVLMVGSMAAAIDKGRMDLDFDVLDKILQALYALTTKSLVHMAERAQQRFRDAQVGNTERENEKRSKRNPVHIFNQTPFSKSYSLSFFVLATAVSGAEPHAEF